MNDNTQNPTPAVDPTNPMAQVPTVGSVAPADTSVVSAPAVTQTPAPVSTEPTMTPTPVVTETTVTPVAPTTTEPAAATEQPVVAEPVEVKEGVPGAPTGTQTV